MRFAVGQQTGLKIVNFLFYPICEIVSIRYHRSYLTMVFQKFREALHGRRHKLGDKD